MRRIVHTSVLGVSILSFLNATALASSITLSVPMRNIATKTDERGTYYLLTVDPPTELAGKRLDNVFVEFVVDVAGSSEGEPMSYEVGVFPLTERYAGTNLSYESGAAFARVASAGENRRIITDITSAVRNWVANPARNYGLVIGALTGPKVESLSLKDSVLAPDVAVRVTFFYQNRFGGRVSTE
jgi:hypothetical protein